METAGVPWETLSKLLIWYSVPSAKSILMNGLVLCVLVEVEEGVRDTVCAPIALSNSNNTALARVTAASAAVPEPAVAELLALSVAVT